ncbi:MAG: magnesium/cobalt transporter CorA [Phycisphaerae bacterium]|nr:magnesium/cobalt transporter CorA [Gemmatimonadaceae bacterium]
MNEPARITDPAVPLAEPAHPLVVFRGADGSQVIDCHPRDLASLLESKGSLWVDIDSTSRTQHALLEKLFHFHPLAIEDTLNPNSRVKLEEYPGYLFIVIRGVSLRAVTEDPYDLETNDLYAFLGENLLVTVHAGPVPAISLAAEQLRRSPDLMTRGVERVLHLVLDETIDGFFPILHQIDDFLDTIEERVFANFDESALRDIFSVKRLVLSLRRYLQPSREVMNVLTNRPTPLLSAETQVYFRDIYDHVLRINDSLDTYRDLLGSTMDSYLTQVSNRLGTATKALSVIATMSLPFVVVSGMWGMNFDKIPLSHWPFGFWFIVLAQLMLGALLLAYLRWRKVL